MPLHRAAVARRTDDLDVTAAELRRFEDRLPATAARSADGVAAPPRDRDPRDLVESERMLCGGERALFGADAEAIAGILHVRARHYLAVDALDGAADLESGVGRIGPKCRRAGEGDQLFICHEIVLMPGNSAAAIGLGSLRT